MLLGEGAPADIAAQAGLPRDYTLRVVRRADALIEKALLASDALDDRVLEVCKLMARDTYNKTHAASPVGALYYAGSASGGQLLFYGQAASGEALHLSVQRDTYDAAAQNLRAALKAPAPLEVNAQWARQVLGTALFTKQED